VNIQTAGISSGVVEVRFPLSARPLGTLRVPDDDLLARHRARNAQTWGVLEVEPDGVSGRTLPMTVSPRLLDEWVMSMLGLGAFRGWTATVARPA